MKPDAIKQLLPWCMQMTTEYHEGYDGLIGVMARLHAGPERSLIDFANYLDPETTPDQFVRYLLSWLDLDWMLTNGSSLHNLRILMRHYPELTQTRGTRPGLELFLQLAMGTEEIKVIEEHRSGFHFTVSVPAAYKNSLGMIRRIVEHEKPAHLSYELEISEEE